MILSSKVKAKRSSEFNNKAELLYFLEIFNFKLKWLIECHNKIPLCFGILFNTFYEIFLIINLITDYFEMKTTILLFIIYK